MPKTNVVSTAATEAEPVLKKAAQGILAELAELAGLVPWRQSKGCCFEDRKGGGKPLFAVKKGATIHLYLGAKERRCEVGALRLVKEEGDNEYNLANALRQAITGPHGGDVLAVLQQI